MKDYGSRIRELITLDGAHMPAVTAKAVGSHRYRVTVRTEGGHSYGAFGNRNAIHLLSSMITTLYTVKVPKEGDSTTTYNVGLISGGTSVNTIAQEAEMLYEYRSDNMACLARMEEMFRGVVDAYRSMDIDVEVEKIGDRPCSGNVDPARLQALTDRAAASIREIVGKEPVFCSGSTDANIPLSVGIPAICISGCTGGKCHTREEWLDTASLKDGMRFFMNFLTATI
jgi:acetylornithine deacetylase/succinyl-diaminopimelate desuccinylase-like protein